MTRANLIDAAVGLIGVSLVAVGGLAVVAPETAAAMFGVPVGAGEPHAYVRAAGVRDVAIGAGLLALLSLRVGRRALGASLLAAAAIPLGDALIVATSGGAGSAPALVLHGAAVVAFLALGAWLWRGAGGD